MLKTWYLSLLAFAMILLPACEWCKNSCKKGCSHAHTVKVEKVNGANNRVSGPMTYTQEKPLHKENYANVQ